MVNLYKKRLVKGSVIGITIISLFMIIYLVNLKVFAESSKKTQNNVKSVSEKQQEVNITPQDNKDYLSYLNIMLPEGWSLDKSNKLEYGIKDEKGEPHGFIDALEYDENYDWLTQKPNHSSVTKDEFVDVPLGRIRLITLDSDNGTPASGIEGTHDLYYAVIPVKDKAIYIVNFTNNDKKPESKVKFLQILKGLSIK